MRILYGFSNCTDKKYKELTFGKETAVLLPDQKYHGLLIKGLSSNGADVKCFSGLPINRSLTNKIFIREKDEIQDGVYYHYYNTVNLPVLRQLIIFLKAFFCVLSEKKQDDTFLICDCLNIANSYGMALAAKLKRIPVITVVTDLPDFMYTSKVTRKTANNFFKLADGFIFITEAMNSRINPNSKPSVVIEGLVDTNPIGNTDKKELTEGVKRIVYSGSVRKRYGIKNLIDGFLLANLDSAELLIYGDGDYADEVKNTTEKNIKYMGVHDNSEVVKAQHSASLLVNPRPTAPEYTKYSFPLKNAEYMASGTPVLSTKLPGIPKEYLPYMLLIEDETPFGIADALKRFFALPIEERTEFGKKASEFVTKQKSNYIQSKKVLDFLQRNF